MEDPLAQLNDGMDNEEIDLRRIILQNCRIVGKGMERM